MVEVELYAIISMYLETHTKWREVFFYCKEHYSVLIPHVENKNFKKNIKSKTEAASGPPPSTVIDCIVLLRLWEGLETQPLPLGICLWHGPLPNWPECLISLSLSFSSRKLKIMVYVGTWTNIFIMTYYLSLGFFFLDLYQLIHLYKRVIESWPYS